MPPFSFMKKYFKFVVDTTTQPSMGDYGSIPVMEPTIFKLNDGSGAIKLETFTSYWINSTIMNNILINMEEEVVLEEAKSSGSVSELTMLKALAIAQQPELALNLLKE